MRSRATRLVTPYCEFIVKGFTDGKTLGCFFTILSRMIKAHEMRKINFEEYELANGLYVILHEDHSTPIVAVDIWYHVGSKNEESHRTGFAHLFEHMMFQGSAHVGKAEHFVYIQKAGGKLNASTTQDRTNYYNLVPSHQLELVLWLESDRMMSLNVNQENFDNQREVVKEERRWRYENRPYGTHWEEIFARAFKVHPYHHLPIGSMDDLNAASLQDVQAFFNKYYVPNNAVLAIAGDIDRARTNRLVKKYFGDIPAGGAPVEQPMVVEESETQQLRDVIYDSVPLPAVYMAFHIPQEGAPEYFPLSLLSEILNAGKSSRLYQRLVYERRVAQSANALLYALEHPGLLCISSFVAQGHMPEEVENSILEELEKMKTEIVSEQELTKVKNQMEASIVNDCQYVLGKADELARCRTFFKNTDEINCELERYASVTREDILSVARKHLTPENSTVLYYLPKATVLN